MPRLSKIKLFLVLVLVLTSCTGGGSGSSSSGGSSGGTGGIGDSTGGSSGGSTGGGTTTGGTTTGGTTTGGTTTGGTTTGGTTTGGTTGGGSSGGSSGGIDNQNITELSVDVNSTSGRVVLPYSVNLNGSGVRLLRLGLNLRSTTAFEVVTKYPGGSLSTAALESPTGVTVIPGSDNLLSTLALEVGQNINNLNYQTREIDPAVVEGSYLQSLLFSSGGPAQVIGTIIAKNDSNFAGGNLDLNVHLVGDEVQKTSNRQAVQNAIAVFKSIYATIGVSVDVVYRDVNSSYGVLPNPIIGSSFYSAQGSANGVRQVAVNLYIGETISSDGTQNPGNSYAGVLGIASSIPGPATPSDYSVVAASLTEHQGPDGFFSVDEQSVFAETMAHECGHYLGLFHPVEPSFNDFDPLSDTPQCISATDCHTKSVDKNLMYPTAVVGLVQRDLTSNQKGVVNRNVIID